LYRAQADNRAFRGTVTISGVGVPCYAAIYKSGVDHGRIVLLVDSLQYFLIEDGVNEINLLAGFPAGIARDFVFDEIPTKA
jgi:hypothetical protein